MVKDHLIKNWRRFNIKYIVIFALCVVLMACNPNKIYEDFNDMDETFWHLDSIQTFTFDIPDSSTSYTMFATFRNTSSYPFYNLYFQYTLADSTRDILIQQIKEVHLFDSKTGDPNGSGLGDLFDHAFVIEEGYKFDRRGKYSLSLQQYMRRDTLPYILSVGVKVEKTE